MRRQIGDSRRATRTRRRSRPKHPNASSVRAAVFTNVHDRRGNRKLLTSGGHIARRYKTARTGRSETADSWGAQNAPIQPIPGADGLRRVSGPSNYCS